MKAFEPPAPPLVEAVRKEAERTLSPEEWAAARAIPISDEERAEVLAMVEWFTRRYPTVRERLAWNRRRMEAARRRSPAG